MAKISIQVPVFNGEKYLLSTLRSIADNAPADSEILVMDDGSKDNSCAIIKEFVSADSRFIFDQNKTDGEIRNIMVNATDSEYIMPFDHDDIFLPGRDESVKYLDEHSNTPAAYGVTVKLQDGQLGLYMGHTFSNFNIFNGGNPAGHGSLIIRRSALEEAGGYIVPYINPENNQPCGSGDWYLIQRLGELGKLHFTKEYSFIYRIHSAQQSKGGSFQKKSLTREMAQKKFTEKYTSEINGVLAGKHVSPTPEMRPVYMQIYGIIFSALISRNKNPEIVLNLASSQEPDDYAVKLAIAQSCLMQNDVNKALEVFTNVINEISYDRILTFILTNTFMKQAGNRPDGEAVRQVCREILSNSSSKEINPELTEFVCKYR